MTDEAWAEFREAMAFYSGLVVIVSFLAGCLFIYFA